MRTLALAGALLAPSLLAQQPSAAFRSYVERAMREWQVPGVAIAAVRNGDVLFTEGFGVRNVENARPVTAHTSFAIASNTKAFTTTLLGTLIDEGRLGWDDRVVDRIPELRLGDPWITSEIRVRDLLCHRSGLPTFGGDCLWIAQRLDSAEVLARLRHLPFTGPFRASYQYQNLMFFVAGEVAARVAGTSWQELLRARILRPLGMAETHGALAELAGTEDVATPYEIRGGARVAVPYDVMGPTSPAGSIHSTAHDMCRWMLLHLGGGELDGRRIVSERVVREMQTAHTIRPVSGLLAAHAGTRFAAYGLGWALFDYRGLKVVQHGGGLSGMISLQTLVPDRGLGVMVLTNLADSALCPAVTYRLLDALCGFDEHDWISTFREREEQGEARRAEAERRLQAQRHQGTKPSLELAAYAGEYQEPLAGRARVVLAGDQLVFDYDRRHRGPLEHWHHDTFRVTWDDPIFDMPARSFVRFELDERGAVARLHVRYYHPHTFERVAASGWHGVLDEGAFAALHELTGERAPEPRGADVTVGGERAYLSLPDGEPRAGVLVIHEWWGLNDHIRHWADRLAADGYAALAVDLYRGTVAATREEASAAMRAVDPAQALATMQAGLAFLRDDPRTSVARIGCIGWCFGGGWSLNLAMAAPELDACVIYYGRLVDDEARLRAIGADVLGVFGDRDRGIPPSAVAAWERAMRGAGRSVRVLRYDAEHAFANPSSARYDAAAAGDAWEKVRAFLAERLGR